VAIGSGVLLPGDSNFAVLPHAHSSLAYTTGSAPPVIYSTWHAYTL